MSVTSLQKVKDDVDKMQYSSRIMIKDIKVSVLIATFDYVSESVFVLDATGTIHRVNSSG